MRVAESFSINDESSSLDISYESPAISAESESPISEGESKSKSTRTQEKKNKRKKSTSFRSGNSSARPWSSQNKKKMKEGMWTCHSLEQPTV